ncbi:hypothetical protein EVAR_8044_1 [Eumeta japonica]|uniref:Uncharacterized protein n=1 Tax=Eumeta variegata TaxID=151549 RepID=A0A4C1TKJ5_EUMVA|nr:hypothetical protein EVAR_8044_1 [Eumeta japonica]
MRPTTDRRVCFSMFKIRSSAGERARAPRGEGRALAAAPHTILARTYRCKKAPARPAALCARVCALAALTTKVTQRMHEAAVDNVTSRRAALPVTLVFTYTYYITVKNLPSNKRAAALGLRPPGRQGLGVASFFIQFLHIHKMK